MDSSVVPSKPKSAGKQSVSWIGTIPLADWLAVAGTFLAPVVSAVESGRQSLDVGSGRALPEPLCWLRGQHEIGDSGFEHCQLVAHFSTKRTLAQVKLLFGKTGHWESTRSSAADDYVHKDASCIVGTRFDVGQRPHRRNSKTDWDAVWLAARSGDLLGVPASLRVVHYRTLRAIASDFMEPAGMERTCHVFWGATGTGKSRDAWMAAGMDAYPKDPRTKFWCGYRGQKNVVVDEFRGGIDVGHILRWLDRYPVIVEVKGGAQPLLASTLWITSNVAPSLWYPELDSATLAALLRRIKVTEYSTLT